MQFEWYNPNLTTLAVSISKYGITFNSDCIETMGSPKYILLGFNEENKVIGAKPCENKIENSIEFLSKKRNGYIRIYNINFIRFIGNKINSDFVKIGIQKKYLSEWDKEQQTLYIFLEKPIE